MLPPCEVCGPGPAAATSLEVLSLPRGPPHLPIPAGTHWSPAVITAQHELPHSPAHGAPLRCGSRDQPRASRLSCSIPAHPRAPQPLALRSHVPPAFAHGLGCHNLRLSPLGRCRWPRPAVPRPGVSPPRAALRGGVGFPGDSGPIAGPPGRVYRPPADPAAFPGSAQAGGLFATRAAAGPDGKPNSGGRNKLPSPNRGSAGLTASSSSFCQRSRASHQDLCQQLRPAGTAGQRPATGPTGAGAARGTLARRFPPLPAAAPRRARQTAPPSGRTALGQGPRQLPIGRPIPRRPAHWLLPRNFVSWGAAPPLCPAIGCCWSSAPGDVRGFSGWERRSL